MFGLIYIASFVLSLKVFALEGKIRDFPSERFSFLAGIVTPGPARLSLELFASSR